jgi:hypothetical protein
MSLVTAEILKLRRRRGLMIWSALLTIGPVVVAYAVLLALHASDAVRHGPAGGIENLDNVLGVVVGLGTVAVIILGTTAGSQDAAAGVFRDLVVTGRSRKALFHARLPAVLALFLPLAAIAFGLAVAASFAFAGEAPTPDLERILRSGAAVAASSVVTAALAVGLGSILPSRVAVGVLVAWSTIVSSLLAGAETLRSLRVGLPSAAVQHLAPPTEGTTTIAMSTGTALLVLTLWIAVALRAGSFRTERRDA